jgi:predicted AlkP superfamily pyrophosphatase or phosphodiesterase
MRKNLFIIIIFFSLLLCLTACCTDDSDSETETNDISKLIAELMPDAPELSITQAYHDTLNFMQNNERVLLILLDGWGWEMFKYFESRQPFLSSLSPQPALSVYPPITPVALASVVTGVQPDIHGIHSRNDRRINDGVTDIFAAANNLGRTVAYVQGFSNIIETSLMPILSPDADGLYGTDNEVFENAKRNLEVDFLFVHFHGIDDEAHTFGPYADEVGERMALIDEYVRYLAENWGSGKIIIVADHGQHNVHDNPNRLGDHSKISHEDMIVPYVITGGEN